MAGFQGSGASAICFGHGRSALLLGLITSCFSSSTMNFQSLPIPDLNAAAHGSTEIVVVGAEAQGDDEAPLSSI